MTYLKLCNTKLNGFIRVKKNVCALFDSMNVAGLLSELISYADTFIKKEDWFYMTREHIERQTALSEYQQRNVIKTLKKYKLIATCIKGLPAKTYYLPNYELYYCVIQYLDLFSLTELYKNNKKILKTIQKCIIAASGSGEAFIEHAKKCVPSSPEETSGIAAEFPDARPPGFSAAYYSSKNYSSKNYYSNLSPPKNLEEDRDEEKKKNSDGEKKKRKTKTPTPKKDFNEKNKKIKTPISKFSRIRVMRNKKLKKIESKYTLLSMYYYKQKKEQDSTLFEDNPDFEKKIIDGAITIDQIIRLDKQDFKKIEKILKWSLDDHFWSSNMPELGYIRRKSPRTGRKIYINCYNKMKEGMKPNKNNSNKNNLHKNNIPNENRYANKIHYAEKYEKSSW